jgi:hypothetical protein
LVAEKLDGEDHGQGHAAHRGDLVDADGQRDLQGE